MDRRREVRGPEVTKRWRAVMPIAEGEVGNESKSPQTHEVRVARRLLAVGRMPERTVGACKIRRASRFLPSQIFEPHLLNSAGQRHGERASAHSKHWGRRIQDRGSRTEKPKCRFGKT